MRLVGVVDEIYMYDFLFSRNKKERFWTLLAMILLYT
jgi:hypothetical protein